MNFRPYRGNRQTALPGPRCAHVIVGGLTQQPGDVTLFLNSADSNKPVERTEGVPAGQPRHRGPIPRILLPSNLRQPDYRHPRVFLEAAHGIAGFD
jgi:hypothetical protein